MIYEFILPYQEDELELLTDSVKVGIDKGALDAINKGIKLDYILGDFDSISLLEYERIQKIVKNIIKLNPCKDDTDTEHAINYFKDASKIIIHGGIKGKRVEHLLANINLLYKYDNLVFKDDITLIDQAIIDEEKAKNKNSKILKLISKIVGWIIFGIIFIFFCFSIVNRFMDNTMMINNNGILVIATPSMQTKNDENDYLIENDLNDQISQYDMITIHKPTNPEDINLYDIVAYYSETADITIVHRVVDIEIVDGIYQFQTQGDANANSDQGSYYQSYLTFDDIVGVYSGTRIPLIGLFVIFLQSYSGIITIVSIIYCMFMFTNYQEKYERAIEERTGLLLDLIELDPSQRAENNILKQELIYKGYKYTFENGNFISKDEIDETGDEKLVVIENDGSNIEKIEKTIENRKD